MDEESPVQVLRDNRNTTTFVQSNSTIDAKAFNKSASVFGQIDYRFSDAWTLDVGVRYSDDNRTTRASCFRVHRRPAAFRARTPLSRPKRPAASGLKFFAGDDTMFYVTASKGYKAGGVNLDPRLATFGPETNKVGEFGVKTTLADGSPAHQRRSVLFRLRRDSALGVDAGGNAAGPAAQHAQCRARGDLSESSWS